MSLLDTYQFQQFTKKLGTTSGTVLTIISLIGTGVGAGVFSNNLVKNIEILEIQKQNYEEVKELKSQIQTLLLENKNQFIKLTEYEKSGKK